MKLTSTSTLYHPVQLCLLLPIASTLTACGPSKEAELVGKQIIEIQEHKKQLDSLRRELEVALKDNKNLKSKLEEALNTPTQMLADIAKYVSNEDLDGATKILANMKAKHPNTGESIKAQELVDSLKTKINKKNEELKRIEALGFKAIKASSTINTGYVRISVSAPNFSKRFTFDSYNNSYHYHDADRDSKYLVASLTATADTNATDPDLPGFAIYWAEGKHLRLISEFDINFSRWMDYGSYLGNYHDSRNDFEKNATIPFKIGAQVADYQQSKRPLYLVATKEGCKTRKFERFENPPVSYSGLCKELKNTLTVDQFSNEIGGVTLVYRID